MTCSNTPNYVVTSGDVLVPQVVGSKYTPFTWLPANGTTPATLFSGAPGYVITEIGMQIDPTCTIASAGMVNLFFSDSSFGTFFNIRWYIPQTIAGINVPMNNRVVNGPGFYFNNKVANSTVSVQSDVAILTGSVRFFARYALTSYIGN